MIMENNLYKILGLTKKASAKNIKDSYYLLSKIYHPDLETGNDDKFKEINKAYIVLSDPQKRKIYDEGGDVEKIGSIKEDAKNKLLILFNKAIEANCNEFLANRKNFDFIKPIKESIDSDMHKLNNNKAKIERCIEYFNDIKEKVKPKKGSLNLFKIVYDDMLKQTKTRIDNINHEIKLYKEVLKILKEYKEKNNFVNSITDFATFSFGATTTS